MISALIMKLESRLLTFTSHNNRENQACKEMGNKIFIFWFWFFSPVSYKNYRSEWSRWLYCYFISKPYVSNKANSSIFCQSR